MRKLFLVRHGRAENARGPDFDRPLAPAGRDEVARVAHRVREQGQAPSAFVSSPAVRAWQTASIWAETFGISGAALVVEGAIYEASLEELIAVVQALDDADASVALFGHNPGFSSLLARLAPHAADGFAAGAAFILELDADRWSDVGTPAAATRSVIRLEPR